VTKVTRLVFNQVTFLVKLFPTRY